PSWPVAPVINATLPSISRRLVYRFRVTLYAMIRSIPIDEPRNSLGDRRRRPEAGVAHQVIDVGVSCGHIAGLHRHKFAFRLLAKFLFKETDNFEQLDWLVVTDVVETPRGAARCRIRQGGGKGCICRGWTIDHTNHGFHDIVDIGEIALHVAIVEQPDWLIGQNRLYKDPHSHVRPPPRPVNREKPKSRHR